MYDKIKCQFIFSLNLANFFANITIQYSEVTVFTLIRFKLLCLIDTIKSVKFEY